MDNSRPVLVDDNNSRYMCIVCRQFLLQPHQAQCGHRACHACFKKLARNAEHCPGDDEDCKAKPVLENNISSDRAFARQELANVVVWCPNKQYGCNEQMRYKDIAAHANICRLRTSCRFGCSATFKRGQYAAHENMCHRKPVPCNQCHQKVPQGDMKKHKETECPESLVVCTTVGCTTVLVRRCKLDAHVAHCHQRCSFQSVGCKEQVCLTLTDSSDCVLPEEGTARHIENHEQMCTEQHWRLSLDYAEKLKALVQPHAQEYLPAAVPTNDRPQQVSNIDSNDAERRAILEDLQRDTDLAQRALDRPQERMDEEASVLRDLLTRVMSLEDRLRALCSQDQDVLASVSGPLSVHSEALLRDNAANLDVLTRQTHNLEWSSSDGRLIMKVTKQLVVAMEKNLLAVIDGVPFFTREGHKLLLSVYPNGHGAGTGTHVSAKLSFLPGDHDQLLRWPLQPEVRFFLCSEARVKDIVILGQVGVGGILLPVVGQSPAVIECPLLAPHHVVKQPPYYDPSEESYFIEVRVETGQ